MSVMKTSIVTNTVQSSIGTETTDLELVATGSGNINASGSQIKDVADPTSDQDAVTKKYSDDNLVPLSNQITANAGSISTNSVSISANATDIDDLQKKTQNIDLNQTVPGTTEVAGTLVVPTGDITASSGTVQGLNITGELVTVKIPNSTDSYTFTQTLPEPGDILRLNGATKTFDAVSAYKPFPARGQVSTVEQDAPSQEATVVLVDGPDYDTSDGDITYSEGGFTVADEGVYLVNYEVRFVEVSPVDTNADRITYIVVNGPQYFPANSTDPGRGEIPDSSLRRYGRMRIVKNLQFDPLQPIPDTEISSSAAIKLLAGDTVRVYAFHDNTTNLQISGSINALRTEISIARIS